MISHVLAVYCYVNFVIVCVASLFRVRTVWDKPDTHSRRVFIVWGIYIKKIIQLKVTI